MSAHHDLISLVPASITHEFGDSQFGAFLRECWRRLKFMHADFETTEAGLGTRSRERSAERLRDDRDWARTVSL